MTDDPVTVALSAASILISVGTMVLSYLTTRRMRNGR